MGTLFWIRGLASERASERGGGGRPTSQKEGRGDEEGEKKFLEGGSSTKFLKGIVRDAPVPCAVRSCAFFTSPSLSLSLSLSLHRVASGSFLVQPLFVQPGLDQRSPRVSKSFHEPTRVRGARPSKHSSSREDACLACASFPPPLRI